MLQVEITMTIPNTVGNNAIFQKLSFFLQEAVDISLYKPILIFWNRYTDILFRLTEIIVVVSMDCIKPAHSIDQSSRGGLFMKICQFYCQGIHDGRIKIWGCDHFLEHLLRGEPSHPDGIIDHVIPRAKHNRAIGIFGSIAILPNSNAFVYRDW